MGHIEQNADKNWLRINQPIEYKDEATGSHISILPADSFSVSVSIDFNSPLLPPQTASLEDINAYDKEISAARTFVFVREIEPLLSYGLIKGGDLDNAVVIYDKETSQESLDKLCKLTNAESHDSKHLGYIQHKPLVWENEPARHKLLDVIGDISLVGRPILGHIIASKPGHTVNNKFARLLRTENS